MRLIAGALIAFLIVAGASPALADTTDTPPGAPCTKNNGNPCNGNNGNLGDQGNAGGGTTIVDNPPPIDLAMPEVTDRGVYISQIGDSNQASVVQSAPNAYARIDQNGDGNDADVSQAGSGTAYAEASQSGRGNFARLEQSGSGQNVLYAMQDGNNNWMWGRQASYGAFNGARLTQSGNNNDMTLSQDGSDNLALLTQDGNNNGMTAVQNGDGNRLQWTQDGNNLSDLQVTQTGGGSAGSQLMITQSNGH